MDKSEVCACGGSCECDSLSITEIEFLLIQVAQLKGSVAELLEWREEITSTLEWLPQELENELDELNDLVPKMFQGLTSPLVLRIKALLLKLSRRMETNERNDESPQTPQPSGRG